MVPDSVRPTPSNTFIGFSKTICCASAAAAPEEKPAGAEAGAHNGVWASSQSVSAFDSAKAAYTLWSFIAKYASTSAFSGVGDRSSRPAAASAVEALRSRSAPMVITAIQK